MMNTKAKAAFLSLALAGAIALPAFAAAAAPGAPLDSKPPVISAYTQELTDESVLTRADLISILHERAGKPVVNFAMSYTDVKRDAPYAEAVRWGSSLGLVGGYEGGGFGPEDPVTREQLAAVLYREAKSQGRGFVGAWAFRLPYEDIDQISKYAFEAVSWMTMEKIMDGGETKTFAPKGQVTYGELKAILELYDASAEKVELADPFTECKTMEEAAKLCGFSLALPEKLPQWVSSTTIRTSKDLLEVVYQGGESELRIRKALGDEDISGDYTSYPESDTVELDGRQIATKGRDGKVMVAAWQDGEYTYAIQAAQGLGDDELASLVSHVK